MGKIKVAFMRGDGCAMSLLPLYEIIAGSSDLMGTKEPEKADILVMQFCAMSKETMGKWSELRKKAMALKEQNPQLVILAGGCIDDIPEKQTEKWTPEMLDEPNLDFANYRFGYNNVAEVFTMAVTNLIKERTFVPEIAPYVLNGAAQIMIEHGCNRRCSFCKTNYLCNMQVVSRPEEEVLDLARRAIKQGIRGVALNAQNSTEYGYGMDGVDLASLLGKLVAMPRIEIVDVTGVCLDEVDERTLRALKHPKVRFIQIELQSLDDNIRRKMNLKKTRDEALAILDALDGKVLSSNFIVGFPGCSPKEFDREMRYIRRHHLYYLTLVTYDNTPGTPSYEMGDLPGKEELEHYMRRYMDVVADEREILLQKLLKEKSIEAHVMIPGGDKVLLQARHYNVEIIAMARGRRLAVGDLVNVKVMGLMSDLGMSKKSANDQSSKKYRYFDNRKSACQAMLLYGVVV